MPIMKKKTGARKAPAVKKAAVKKAAPKKKAAAAKAPAKKTEAHKARVISSEERYQMIQTAAYYRAQANGFQGDPRIHWAEAEKEVNKLLGS